MLSCRRDRSSVNMRSSFVYFAFWFESDDDDSNSDTSRLSIFNVLRTIRTSL